VGAGMRLDQGGVAASEGKGAAGAARREQLQLPAAGGRNGAQVCWSGRPEGAAVSIYFGCLSGGGKGEIGWGNFVISHTFLLKTIILIGLVSRTQIPQNFSVFGQRQVFLMCCSNYHVF